MTSEARVVAFVAGATGFVGREVVRASAEAGVRTVAHVRPGSPQLEEWRTRFRAMGAEMDSTPWQEAAMIATLAAVRPAHVYALLGTTRRRAAGEGLDAEQAYERIDYGLTALLLRAVVAAGLRPRFVYLSALGVREGQRTGYMGARARFEVELKGSPVPWTIARPSFIVGEREDSRPGERAVAAVTDGLMAVAGLLGAREVQARYTSTSGEILGRALVRLAADPAFENAVAQGAALRAP